VEQITREQTFPLMSSGQEI